MNRILSSGHAFPPALRPNRRGLRTRGRPDTASQGFCIFLAVTQPGSPAHGRFVISPRVVAVLAGGTALSTGSPHPWQAGWTLLVIVTMVALLATDRVSPAMAVLGADIALLVSGVIDVDQAFAGFSNSAPITVAALFVVAHAVEKTGALQPVMSLTLGRGKTERGRLARLLFSVAGASAFLNNTPIVAMLAPQVSDWCEKRGLSPARFLMPLSFATILGGTITLIGTSTNLVVSGLLEQRGYPPIGMFELTRLGLPIAIAGVLVLVGFTRVLLPERRPARQVLTGELREYVVQLEVMAEGPLDGSTVEAAGLRHLQGVFLAEVRRNGEVIAPAGPQTVLRGGDQLTFVGQVDIVRDLQLMRGLVSSERKHALGDPAHTFFEAVVSATSSLAGKTLAEAEFRGRFQGAVIAIHRSGSRVSGKLGTVKLKEGDTLLVLSDPGFRDRWRDRNEFLLVSHLGGSPPVSAARAVLTVGITLLIVLVAGLGLLPIVQTALLGAVALIVFRVLSPAEARRSLNLDVLILIAASFGIGAAIDRSGLAAVLAGGIDHAFGRAGPLAILVAVSTATVLMTAVITNNAAAVLLFPIAIAAAKSLSLDPRPFAMAVAVAASASFLTPIGYQTNMMVYGPGGYRFGDYPRLGVPLAICVIVGIAVLVPLFWPMIPLH